MALPAMSGMPSLNMSSASSAKAGDINAPSTVYFGGFGTNSGGGAGALGAIPPAMLVAGAILAVVLLRRKR
jgi:hypothetical protein